MRAITCTHASTRATGLMQVKNSTHHFYLWHVLFRDKNVQALDEITTFSLEFVPLPTYLRLNNETTTSLLFLFAYFLFTKSDNAPEIPFCFH